MLEITLDRHLVGGVRLAANKTASTAGPIVHGVVPPELVLALHQHGSSSAEPVVGVGRRVLKGELIAKPGAAPSAAVHASSSGTVRAIEERLVPTGSRLRRSLCIVIETDGEDRAVPAAAASTWPTDRDAQLERIALGGLAGLGGAVYPTAAKIASVVPCKAVIVNGAECEPYISCDDLLMREAPDQIVSGARLLAELTGASECIIAIERDKPKALEAIAQAARTCGDARLRLAGVPTVYPAGGERQLIELLTGEEVPSGRFPTAIGYVCQNVGTVYALHRLAVHGEPLVSRIVTITGGGVARPQNLEVPIGASIGHLIERCGGYTDNVERLIHGGSMMGYALPGDDFPVTKATSCIIAATAVEVRSSSDDWPCIRCGECASACPARLLPQQIYAAALARDFDDLAALGLRDCIECGCCDVVCPSHISLTEHFRRAKREFSKHEQRAELSAASEQRHERRERRLRTEESKSREAQAALRREVREDAKGQDAVRAAVQRAKRRREESR